MRCHGRESVVAIRLWIRKCRQRLLLSIRLRTGHGGKMFPYETEMERPLVMEADRAMVTFSGNISLDNLAMIRVRIDIKYELVS